MEEGNNMGGELFDKQMLDGRQLATQIEADLSQAEQQTAGWLTTVEEIGDQVQPVLNDLLEISKGDTRRLRQLHSSTRTVLDLLDSLELFVKRARFHPQVIHFRCRILSIKIQYWFFRTLWSVIDLAWKTLIYSLNLLYRLLPYAIAFVVLILAIIYWEEIVAFLTELLGITPAP